MTDLPKLLTTEDDYFPLPMSLAVKTGLMQAAFIFVVNGASFLMTGSMVSFVFAITMPLPAFIVWLYLCKELVLTIIQTETA